MLSILFGGVIAWLIAFFALSVYAGVDVAIAGIVAAICSIAAMFVVAKFTAR